MKRFYPFPFHIVSSSSTVLVLATDAHIPSPCFSFPFFSFALLLTPTTIIFFCSVQYAPYYLTRFPFPFPSVLFSFTSFSILLLQFFSFAYLLITPNHIIISYASSSFSCFAFTKYIYRTLIRSSYLILLACLCMGMCLSLFSLYFSSFLCVCVFASLCFESWTIYTQPRKRQITPGLGFLFVCFSVCVCLWICFVF